MPSPDLDDRVGRLVRLLNASTQTAAHDVFLTEAERIEHKIRAKEEEIRQMHRANMHGQTGVSPLVVLQTHQEEVDRMRADRDRMMQYHRDRLDMIYLSLRDVYNKDADANAQVGVEKQ